MASYITDTFQKVKRTRKEVDSSKVASSSKLHVQQSDDGKVLDEMQVLKEFDLTLEYGPCTGITRLERWERAEKHGMNPPQEVRQIVLKNINKEDYLQCLWKDYEI